MAVDPTQLLHEATPASPLPQLDAWTMLLSHREAAVRIVQGTTGNRNDAEDCVHDAILRLARRPELHSKTVRAVLVHAAVHIARDRHRAGARAAAAQLRLSYVLSTEVATVEDDVECLHLAESVRELLRELTPREREVVRLRLADLPVGEIATRLGLSRKTVEGASTRARMRLRVLAEQRGLGP